MNYREPIDEPTDEERAYLASRGQYMPTLAEIDAMKRKIREEKGETEPIVSPEPDWAGLAHILELDDGLLGN